MNKQLEYYLELDYPIIIKKLKELDGGGYFAEIPDLPGCYSDGETPQEAYDNIQDAKKCWLEVAIEKEYDIALPNIDNEEYSGKFTLRIPKTLHKQLAKTSKEEGISLNQYIQTLLAYNFGRSFIQQQNRKNETEYHVKVMGIVDIGEPVMTDKIKKQWESWARQSKTCDYPFPTIIDGGRR